MMNTGDMDEVVARFARGEEGAFRLLYERHRVGLRYFVAGYLGDDEGVEDVVQDAFVALWEKRADFREERAVKAYLYRAARNDCLNLKRRERARAAYARHVEAEGEAEESFLDRVMEAEVFDALRGVFEALTPAQREVYRLSLEGLSQEEIAERLNITVNTVKKHKNNANHFMRERMKGVLALLAMMG